MCKEIRCDTCLVIVIKAETGSLIKKETICYCKECAIRLKAILRLIKVNKKNSSPFGDIFEEFKKI